MKKKVNLSLCVALFLVFVGLFTMAFFSKKNEPLPVVVIPAPDQLQVEKVTSLADTNHYPQRPVWSPDGKMIAFSMQKSDGIEVMNSDGSNRRILTEDIGSGYKFAWSPDNAEIAYRLNNLQESIYQIKTVNVASGKAEMLFEQREELHPPEWVYSEKGKRISFVAGTKRINTNWQKLTGPVPVGQKNTDKILYFDQDNIWVMNEDGSQRKQLSFEVGYDPVWSPDRTRIVYSQMDTMVLIDPDGQNKVVLGYGNHPTWSPDGKKLAFQVTQDHSHATDDTRQHADDTAYHLHNDKTNHRIVESDIYVVNADGKQRRRLTMAPGVVEADPCWSPDGRKILYRIEGTGEIQVAELKW